MYIAMNRFKVKPEEQEAYTRCWLERDVLLKTVPGFVAFRLLRSPEREDHVLYASHTVWSSQEDFEAWTRSEQFRATPSGAGPGKQLMLTGPVCGVFAAGQEVLSA